MGLKKRGQFTVYVILGFMLLVIVLFTLFIVSFIQDSGFESQANKAVTDFLDAYSIDYYIFTCMDTSVNEAILEISKQGGVYYNEVGGNYVKTVPGNTHIRLLHDFGVGEEEVNVSYSVRDDYGCNRMSFGPPHYPFSETKILDLKNVYFGTENCRYFPRPFKESGVFGFNNFSRMCFPESTNFNWPPSLISPCVNNVNTREETTVEIELANMIVNKMNNCTNFTVFALQEEHNITLLDNPSAKIIVNDQTLSVLFEFPFEVKLKNKEPVIVKKKFEYASNLRFIALHNFVLKLLIEEVQNPLFNLTTDYPDIVGYDPNNYVIDIIDYNSGEFQDCIDCPWKHDFILKVEDRASEATGQFLTILTAFQNRYPALDYIHETGQGIPFDIIRNEGTLIELKPWGVDPEEGAVSVDFSGWKEDYDEKYRFGELVGTVNCSNPQSFDDLKVCIRRIDNPDLKIWSTSYSANGVATYTVDRDDTGIHETRITITDSAGQDDYQDIKFLIMDVPTILMDVLTPYDIPQNQNPDGPYYISREDPFSIDSTDSQPPSTPPGASIEEVEWTIEKVTPSGLAGIWLSGPLRFDPSNRLLNTIRFPEPWYPSIQNIHNEKLKDVGEYQFELILYVTSSWFLGGTFPFPDTRVVYAEECIPNRYGGDSYPYNSGTNAYLTNHACCAGDISNPSPGTWNVETPNKVCFNQNWYGEIDSLQLKAKKLMKDAMFNDYDKYVFTIPQLQGGIPPDKNNVYKLTFERSCDGQRGNICAGSADYMYDFGGSNSICQDKPLGQEGTCQGPAKNPTSTPMSCVNYPPGETFESNFVPGGDFRCETTPTCSTLTGSNSGTYNVGGPMRCTATCDGSGVCKNVRKSECACSLTYCGANAGNPNGAQCESTLSSHRVGIICRSNCDVDLSCGYQDVDDLPCNPDTQSYCFNPVYGPTPACYTQVKCEAGGPSYPTPDICERRGHVVNLPGGDQLCFYGGGLDECNPDGTCARSEDRLSAQPICPVGQTQVCTVGLGYQCQ